MQSVFRLWFKVVLHYDIGELVHGSNEDCHTIAQRCFELFLKLAFKERRIFCLRLENNIPSLNVGLDIRQPEGFEYLSQLIHLDDLGSANIDGA